MANYTSVRNTGAAYTSINLTGSAFDSWRNTTSFTQDDNRSDFTDIGFDFWYNGVRYTQFSASTNGYIDFSSSTADGGPSAGPYGYDNSVFTNNTNNATNTAIAPFYDDLMAQGGTQALGNSIKYGLSGAAPNRTLTIEWINMAVYGNVTPSLNFQVKLVESKGIILINYGVMNQGTFTFSYSMGMNGQTLNGAPTAAQLKELQTVNTNVFSNTQQNNLSAMPAANSQYIFTPPVPAVPTGSLTFSGVSQTGMTLNWPNWATNEIGYVIYNSTDNVNFNFVSQTAANATSSAITGLLPSTTYYWKLYAVTEGCLSTALTGTQSTLAGGNKISVSSTMWNTATTWSPTGVPTAADNVTIANGHTVTVNVDAVCNNLTIGQGTSGVLAIGNNNTSRLITVNGNVIINNGATFSVSPTSNTTHNITFPGNITNNGSINFAPDANSFCDATFTKNGNQTISGTGVLTLNYGTFKLSTTGPSNIMPYSVAATIPQKGGIWLNSALSTMNNGGSLTMYGNITVSNGVFNVGNVADEDLLSNGGYLTATGGTLNIAGKYYAIGINNLSKFTIAGGSVIVPSIGSTNTTIAPFQIAGAGSQFNMSGGSLIIPREGGTGAQNLGFINTGTSGGSVTGGTLQIGSSASPAAQIIQINSTYPIGSLLVNSANANASLLTNTLSVINDITLSTGTLTANNLAISLGRNWINNGGAFVPGTGTVFFPGTLSQTIFKSGGETFNDITFSNSGTKTLLSAINAKTLTINSGTLSAGNFNISLTGNWTNNGGTFDPGTALVTFTATTPQTIFKSAGETFNNITFSNTGNKSLLSSISANTLTINSGSLTANSFSISLIGNWVNNGGTFVPGTGSVLFAGTSAQTIFKSGGETFNNILSTGTGTTTLLSVITATNMTINTGSSFDVNTANYQISLKGNFTNSGTFNARKGLVLLNGTLAQSIGGSSTTNFYDLTLNNNAGANITHAENLVNTLTLNNGTFNTNSQVFTMVSTATNTARIAPITGTGDIVGNVNVQRYAPGGYTGWALLGTPISSALTFQSWNDNFAISCASCPNGTAGGFTSIYYYNEAAAGSYSASASYVPLTSITNSIISNKGYWVYLGTGQTTTAPITIDVSGTVRKFNNNIPITRTNTGVLYNDGWNLIHNPYPSPIKWSLLRNGNTNVDNAIYGYNADLNGGKGASVSYVNGVSSPAVGAGGIGDTIPMCQGFQVHCSATTTLAAKETNKVAGNPTFLKMNQTNLVPTTQQLLRLHLKGPGNFSDETVLYIEPNATDSFDMEYDAIKLPGRNPNTPLIMLQNGANDFQINGIAPIMSTYSAPVKTTTGYTGTYTVNLVNFNSFPTGACISLYDSITGITTDLKNSNYIFTLNAGDNYSRFKLNITINPLTITSDLSQPSCIEPNNGAIAVVGNNSGPWNYYWKNANGTIIKTALNKATADTLLNLSGGNYSINMNTVGQCDNHDSTFTINTIEVVAAQFSSVDTTYMANGGVVTFTNTSSNSVSDNWNFGDGFGFSSISNPTYNYTAPGIYTVSLIASSNSGCLDTAYKSIVVISDLTTGLLSQNNFGGLLLKTMDQNEFLLQGTMTEKEILNIKLVDGLGKLLMDYGHFNSTEMKLPLNLRNYKPGIYYLNISGSQTYQTIKLPVK
ncbi:MAG: PKD domain-containing protein [Bacteroidetes bacterium]|nr:PKD domain-containing protein [Bacteroidota bacterium]